VAKVGLDAGKAVIAQRAAGQRVIEIIGGKKVHPVTAIPGGNSKRVTKEEQQEIIKLGEQMVEFAKFTIKVLNDVVLANKGYVDLILSDMFTNKTYNMGLVDANGKTNFYDGRSELRRRTADMPNTSRDYLNTSPSMLSPTAISSIPIEESWLEGFVDGMDLAYTGDAVVTLQCCRRNGDATAQAEYERMYEILTGDCTGKTPITRRWQLIGEKRVGVCG
jgi:F420-non-reducing hydrogenase large subunit